MILRACRRGVLAAAAATLLIAAPAGAHPHFDPAEAPVDSLAELTLDIAHGCLGDHDEEAADGDEEATREVAVEVPDEVAFVRPVERDGWDLDIEMADDGRVEVVTWTADDADEPAPSFELDTVHTGEVDDVVHWRVFQGCDEGRHRWIGTPDEEADDPAVTVTLVAADPDSPPPEEPEEGPVGDDEPEEEDTEPAEEPDTAPDDEDPAAAEVGGGLPGWLVPVAIAALLALLVGLLAWRARSGRGPAT